MHEHHEHKHNHDDCHEGCACERGILEDIDQINEKQSKKPLLIIGIGIILFILGHYFQTSPINYPIDHTIISQIIFIIIFLFVGKDIIKSGISSLLNKEVKIELLVTISAIGAFLLNSGQESAILIILFYLAELFEDYALNHSKKSISNLVKLSPDTATVRRDNKEIQINVDEVNIGDIVIVKPGDKIPVDGIVINGISTVNQASITGESIGVSKEVGDEVFSSTINEEGYMEIEVNKTSDNTIFAKIIDLIKESESKKAKIDLFVDKFAKYYTPLIIVLAVLVSTIPTLIFNQALNQWIYKALVLLVISCPCALVISTPISMVSAITAGAKKGIVIKGGEYIEELSKTKAVMFDKTGTLTEGKLEIVEINPIGINKEELERIFCSIEERSNHPIAKTFKEYRQSKKISISEVKDFKSIPGKGISGKIHNTIYYIGKKDLFDYNEDIYQKIESITNNLQKGKTIMFIGDNENLLAYILLNDKIRDESLNTIYQLNSKNIKTIMLTGDNSKTASEVANILGLSKYYSNLLPEDKVNIVEELSNKYNNVTMVGDGVNDTPSLARANVGIAMGLNGSDVAVETGDIVLINDDISKVDYMINLAKKTMNVIKENITLSIIVKGALAVCGILGFISLGEAVLFGDMGLTLVVVANALRLAR